MENLSAKEEKIKLVKKLIGEIFFVSLITYFILYFLETLAKGFVTNFFNLNILVWLSLSSGVVSVIFHSPEEKEEPQKGKKIVFGIIGLSLATAAIIWYKSRSLGAFSYALAVLSFLITYIIIKNIFEGNNKGENL